MKELVDVIHRVEESIASGKDTTVALVFKVIGHSYRRPGARMVISDNQKVVGSISAGCLEEDIKERAHRISTCDQPQLIKYDAQSEGDILWGTGSGCGGVVYILVEKINPQIEFNYLNHAKTLLTRRMPFVLATAIEFENDEITEVNRLILDQNKKVKSNLTDDSVRSRVLEDAIAIFGSEKTQLQAFDLDTASNKRIEVLFEYILPPISLLIFGAGDDAIPMVRCAKNIGWSITILDHRSQYATRKRFPEANAIIVSEVEKLCDNIRTDTRTAVVIMTHNFLIDVRLIKALLPKSPPYIGLLGAKTRTTKLIDYLEEQEDVKLSENQLKLFYGPAGLDINSETSEEIAVSIVAEIQAVLNGRRGKLLREIRKSIH